uniref:Coiled-coil domain-containing protein 42-like n=1 Tax=Labrus bergylta TaxID=56723 RepID=A0A3Q3LRP8_9LABR
MTMSSISDVEKELQRLPEGTCIVVPGGVCFDQMTALLDIHKKQQENEDIKAEVEESKAKLENLKKRKDELEEEIGGYMSLDAYTEQLCKEDEAYRTTERMQREREEELQKREEVKRLREEYVRLQDKKAELHRQVERDAVYQKYMERAVKMTKFKDVPQLISNFERLLRFEELHQRDAESAQKVEENKRTVAALKDQHNLVWLQRNNEMYPLPAELAKERSKSVTWERRWAHIKQTAAKKTLLMGQIKMAAFNLYDMRSGAEDGEKAVDMCDTETQLEEVQKFFQDSEDFLRQHQPAEQRLLLGAPLYWSGGPKQLPALPVD